MSQTVSHADWLNTPQTRAVIAALEAAQPGGARFVGGCVRNTLMGRPVDDIDIATQLAPEETLAALKAAGIRAIPTGIEHGTVTAVIDHIPFEITSLRRDVETDGRRAVVAFTKDWAEDAQRRDFRLNAIYADGAGTLYDPTGGGIEDAAAGRIIFIGDADARLREDYLRILRFFRFNTWYGRGALDADGLAACARQKAGLKQIAAERIWKEFKKLLSAPIVSTDMDDLQQSGVLDIILPDWRLAGKAFDPDDNARANIDYIETSEDRYGLPVDPIRRLLGLLMFDEQVLVRTATRLKMSNAERDRLLTVLNVPGFYETRAEVLRAQYRFGRQALQDWVASTALHIVGDTLKDSPDAPVFRLKGEDLVKAGLKPGPAIGQMLRALENWWIEGDFTADKQALLEELERRLKAD